MTRSQRLREFCRGRTKQFVASRYLKIPPQYLSYLLSKDIDKLIARIDALPLEEAER